MPFFSEWMPASDGFYAMAYLIAYDITDARRLRRVARRLERRAIRVQKSVFRFRGDHSSLQALLGELQPMLDLRKDKLAAWRLTPAGPERDVYCALGQVPQLPFAAVVYTPQARIEVQEDLQ